MGERGTEMTGGEDFAAGFATLRVESVAIREGAAGVRCDAPVHELLASGGIGERLVVHIGKPAHFFEGIDVGSDLLLFEDAGGA